MKLLNIGCGTCFHPSWTNLDLVAQAPGIIEHDLCRGLPFSDESYDAVYHSHVLEHLAPCDGQALLQECFRVLQPGGVIRVVVPDLEAIARTYIRVLEAANEDSDLLADLEWMRIELLDQMVRTKSGGQMLWHVKDPDIPNAEFVRSRCGDAVFDGDQRRATTQKKSLGRRLKIRKRLRRLRHALTLAVVAVLLGKRGYLALREGLFRQSGEVHQWMYDRISLKNSLESVGFTQASTYQASQSRIRGFADYGLDFVGGRVRKPDSLFVEAIRPVQSPSAADLEIEATGKLAA